MLEFLHLAGAPAFSQIMVTKIGPLKPVNFIFGPNGSGKTTISRALADPGRFSGTTLGWLSQPPTPSVKVYNRDYVADTLQQAHLPGVFLLGKKDVEIQAEIEGLIGPLGSIAAAKKRLDGFEDALAKKQGEIDSTRNELKEAAWSKRTAVPAELLTMFAGYNNNKENLLAHLVEVAAANPTASETFDALKAEAAAVLADDATPFAEFPLGIQLRLEDAPGFELLATPVVGSANVRLAPLIQQLQNADWVEHGRDHLSQSPELCPFCQQKVPVDLAEQLDAYFDKRYSEQITRLKRLRDHVQTWAAGWRSYLESLPGQPGAEEHLNAEMFQTAKLQLEQVVAQLETTIAAKLTGPSTVLEASSPTTAVEAVNAVVGEANNSIRTFNLRLRSRATAKKALLGRCWVVFARQTIAAEVGRYEGAMPSLTKGKEGIDEAISAATTDLGTKRTRLSELQSQVTSSKPIIDKINRLLDSVGFHTFQLAESAAVQDGYSVVRADGDVVGDTLSEGERTFITFLYFAQSLEGATQNSSEPNDLIAVIDDPISSLDSDVLYAVSTVIRRIVAGIAAGTGRVRQLVLLTHNAHFHKEVTYKRLGDKDSGWQYGIVRKRSGQPSDVILTSENPIQTAYGALWDEVKRMSSEPSASASGLQNTLRRILETYFKVLGGVDDNTIITNFEGEDQTICRALFSWVNAGSHSIFDDLDYSPTPTTIEANLGVFRRIFEVQGQRGHYDMMMGETATGISDPPKPVPA